MLGFSHWVSTTYPIFRPTPRLFAIAMSEFQLGSYCISRLLNRAGTLKNLKRAGTLLALALFKLLIQFCCISTTLKIFWTLTLALGFRFLPLPSRPASSFRCNVRLQVGYLLHIFEQVCQARLNQARLKRGLYYRPTLLDIPCWTADSGGCYYISRHHTFFVLQSSTRLNKDNPHLL